MSQIPDAQFWRGDVSVSAASWSVADARFALDSHEAGSFAESAQLVDAFGRDDRIPGCLDVLVSGFLAQGGLPFAIKPVSDAQGMGKIARRIERRWFDWFPEETMRGLIEDRVQMGFCHLRKVWDTSTTPWTLRLEYWPTHGTRYDRTTRRWFSRLDGDTREVELTPEAFVLIGSGPGRSWMRGAVRSLGEILIGRIYAVRDWNRFNERHGMPILAVKEPGAEQDEKKRTGFFSRLVTLASRGVLRLPQGENPANSWDANLLEPKDGAWQTFQAELERFDASIAIRLLGQNLTTEVKGGSFAAASIHEKVATSKLSALAEMLATELRRQVVIPYGRATIAGWKDDYAPWPTWDLRPPADTAAQAKTFKDAADAFNAFKTAGFDIDPVAYAERFGLPLIGANKRAAEDDDEDL